MIKNYTPTEKDIFHVHTWRCKHAESVPDYIYVENAIELGAKRIFFTDHAPFPGNPFEKRMDYEQLPEYIKTISFLKEKYKDSIEVLCGLELEYLPSFAQYYEKLYEMEGLDILILGQHFYEHEPGVYSFSDEDMSDEYIGLCDAMIQGVKTGLFKAVAHPDRAFRRIKIWGEKEDEVARKLMDATNDTYIEYNYASIQRKNQFKREFWELKGNKNNVVYGLDAHSVGEMIDGWKADLLR